MSISPAKKKQLKQMAHALVPVVILGAKGLTDAVQAEINHALDAHELIKIRVNAIDKESRNEMIDSICTQQQADLVQAIGHLAVIYRKRQKKDK